ncbi:MAG: hypothetical protein AAF182_01745 [Pseudomonadota bacterium]
MSIDKQLKNTGKIAAGAAVVALSGFVPQPAMQQAHAANSATVNVTGSFITGISIVAQNDLQFGTLVATGSNGSYVIAPTTTVADVTSNVKAVGGQNVGDFKLAIAVTGAKVDVTVANIGVVDTLNPSVGLNPAVGATLLKVEELYIGKTNFSTPATKLTFASGGGTTATIASAFKVSTTLQQTINFGGQLSWGATQPIGQFTQPVTITMNF